MTTDPTNLPTNTYQWNAEGRLVTIVQSGATYVSYTYNSLGQMVEAYYPGFSLKSDTVYDPAGRELGHYSGTGNSWYDRDVWAGGRMVAQIENTSTYFLHANALGSDTQVTDQGGNELMDILYYPWGQIWKLSGSEVDTHFAGFQETGLSIYPTPNRMYASSYGRWLSPDPLAGDVSNPQSLNRYAYVMNNPTSLTDPLGLHPIQAPAPTTCPPQCGYGDIAPGGNDIFDAIGGASGTSIGTDMFGNVQWGWSTSSPFQYQFSGTLYGHSYNPPPFDSWDAYADWRTGIAALPASQAYDNYIRDCQHSSTACTGGETLTTRYQGPTGNYALAGHALDPNSMSGMIPDPSFASNLEHGGPSWYTWSAVDAGHVATSANGEVESHTDAFNGVLMFPFHFLFDVVPSFFINPKPGVTGPTYTCSPVGGCH